MQLAQLDFDDDDELCPLASYHIKIIARIHTMTEALDDNAPKEVAAVRATSGSANQDGNTVDTNKAQTRTDATSGDTQKDTSDTKTTSSSRYNTDIYGRVPGKEPKYPIPCPSK